MYRIVQRRGKGSGCFLGKGKEVEGVCCGLGGELGGGTSAARRWRGLAVRHVIGFDLISLSETRPTLDRWFTFSEQLQ